MTISYFSDWQTTSFTCAGCARDVLGAEASLTVFTEICELNCNHCGSKLGLISLPTEADITAAAASGNQEAAAMLPDIASAEQWERDFDKAKRSWRNLPDVVDTGLTFSLACDYTTDAMNPEWLLLMHDGEELYRERSGFEHWEAVIDIGKRLLRRYPGQVAWLDPAEAGNLLLGDNLRAAGHIEQFLDNNNLRPPSGPWAG